MQLLCGLQDMAKQDFFPTVRNISEKGAVDFQSGDVGISQDTEGGIAASEVVQ